MGRTTSGRVLLGQRPTVLLPPSKVPQVPDGRPPDTQLQLQWAYGFNGQAVNAVQWISETQFVFCLAALCVVETLELRRQRIFVGHSQRVTCLSYCPSQQLCASGQSDPKGGAGPFICIWRPADCILLSCLVFRMHEEQISALCFDPEGNRLFSLGRDSANTLAVWENFLPGKAGFPVSEALELPIVYRDPVSKVATGRVSAFGMAANHSVSNFQVAVFDAGRSAVGLMLKFFTVVEKAQLLGRCAIFPPEHAPRHVMNCCWVDGRCLACGDNGYVFLFEGNAATGLLHVSSSALGFAVPMQGQLLLGSHDSTLHTVALPRRPGERLALVSSVGFGDLKGARLFKGLMRLSMAAVSQQGTLLGTENHRLIFMDSQWRVRLLHASHEGELGALALHPKLDLLASGATDATVRFWDVREHSPLVGRVLDFETKSGIHSLAFSPSGHLLAVGFGDGHCQLCRVPELSALVAVRLGLERLAALRFVSDELLAAGSWDQMVYLVSTSNVKSFRLLRGNTSSVTQLQASSDHRFLMTNSKDGQVLFFSVFSGERVTQETVKDLEWEHWSCPSAWHTTGMWASNPHLGHAGIKSCRALKSSTGEELLLAGDTQHQVKMYHFPAQKGQHFHTYDGHAGFVLAMVSVGTGPQTHLITAGGDDRAILQWRFESTAPARSRAWQDRRQEPPEPMPLREPLQQRPRERPPWEHDSMPEIKGRAAAPGPWVQHGDTRLPYAEQLDDPPPRPGKKAPRSPPEPLEKPRGGSPSHPVAGVRGQVKDERKSLRQLGTYSGRHLLNSRTMADLGGEG